MVSSYDETTKKITHRAVNSCLTPVCDVNGKAVITVEGLGSVRNGLHPIQQRFQAAHASQCGYCTPGMVMSFYALLRTNPHPTAQEIVDHMDGNLCRCTGYRPIMSAMKSFASDCCGAGTCENCPGKQVASSENTSTSCATGLTDSKDRKPLDLDGDFIFPPSLKKPYVSFSSSSEDGNCKWFAPNSLEVLGKIFAENPSAHVIGGNGQLLMRDGVYVSLKHIPEFSTITHNDSSITIGSACTLESVREFFAEKKSEGLSYDAVASAISRVASRQVRGNCTIGGNVVSNEWHGDLNAVLMTLNATATIVSVDGTQTQKPISGLKLQSHDLLLSITVKKSSATEFVRTYKLAPRDATCRGIVSGALRINVENGVVQDFAAVFSCISDGPERAIALENYMKGKPFSVGLTPQALLTLSEDIDKAIQKLNVDVISRQTLVKSFVFKFLHSADAHYTSGLDHFKTQPWPVTTGVQSFPLRPNSESLGKPIPHASGDLHTTGEACYTADIDVPNCHYGACVLSKRGHAKVLNVNTQKARAMPGVRAVLLAKDLKNNTVPGMFGNSATIFADVIEYYGQLVSFVVADTAEHAEAAAAVVEVEYEDLPVVASIDEAIAKDKFATLPPFMHTHFNVGDVAAGKATADYTVKGEFELSGAVHWYMEPHAHVAIPGERNEISVFTTTQGTSAVVGSVSACLGIPTASVNVSAKRLGGSFGGKGMNTDVVCATSAAAFKLNVPVKTVMKRSDDLLWGGKRGNFKFRYSAGANKDGKIVFIDAELFNNGGWDAGFAGIILMEACESLDNCYFTPNFKINGKSCVLNRAKTIAMRGAGKPQAMALIETIMEHLSHETKIDPMRLRELNFYKEGDVTPFHQTYTKEDLAPLFINWKRILETSQYEARKSEVLNFNSANKWKKRGISIVPTRYNLHHLLFNGMSKTNAFVSLLPDGSCVLVHGGIEMGQGLHTKVMQICANELGIPVESIVVPTVSSFGVANGTITGGSTGTDVNGTAVKQACSIINERLKPIKEANPGKSIAEICGMAVQKGINLTGQGYFDRPNWGNLMETQEPLYCAWNVGVVEVELDVLTGHNRILRADIIQDIGESISPMIDIGQIEGGFVQGNSFFLIEDLEKHYSADGKFNVTYDNYDIASFRDIPVDLRVEITPGIQNPKGIESSKGVGEPPYCLSIVSALALRHAIASARAEHGYFDFFKLDLPANRARVLQALSGAVTHEVPPVKHQKNPEE